MIYRRYILPSILLALAWGFYLSSDFMEVAAGVAIFMFGMLSLEQGFHAFTGGILERVLRTVAGGRWKSLGFGFVATAIMQSSSLVSLISISFLSAGLIGLVEGIGIIFGANIGTTTGAWLMASFGVSIDLSKYALPFVAFGILLIFQKDRVYKGLGHVLFGIALLFIGIQSMKDGFAAFSETIDLAAFAMEGLLGLLVYTFIGILATVVMQSSHATLMLTIAALATGQVTYENALALSIGSNVGTTITAVLGSLTAGIEGRRLAGAHLVFNFLTGAVAIAFIIPLKELVDVGADWLGLAADNYTLRLALFHTIFNILGVVLVFPFSVMLANWLKRVIREPEVAEGEVEKPRYLNEAVLEFPDTAISALTREIVHMAWNVLGIIAHTLSLRRTQLVSDVPIKQVVAESGDIIEVDLDALYAQRVKGLYSGIIEYCSRAQSEMSPEQVTQLQSLRTAAFSLVEAIKILRVMKSNLHRAARSDNAAFKAVYDGIREHMGTLLRELMSLRNLEDLEAIKARLKELRLAAEADDIVANGTLDRLIRDKLIDEDMASSIMNDTAYAFELHNAVIRATEILFAAELPHTVEEETDIAAGADIDEEMSHRRADVQRMLQESRAEIDRRIAALRDPS